AGAIGLALITESDHCPRLYFYNVAGSGAGAALPVGLLEVAPVEAAVLAVGALAQGAAVLALLDAALPLAGRRSRRLGAAVGLAAMATLTLAYAKHPPTVRLSQYKGLSYALNLPEARLVAQRSSPLGRVDVVASPAIRHAPGLSLLTPREAAPPPQLGLQVDAASAGTITEFDRTTTKLAYQHCMTRASPSFARQDS